MLGRLRMSTEDALVRYNDIAGRIFSKENKKWKTQDGTFKASTLEAQVKLLVAEEVEKIAPASSNEEKAAQSTEASKETKMLDESSKDGMGKVYDEAFSSHGKQANRLIL